MESFIKKFQNTLKSKLFIFNIFNLLDIYFLFISEVNWVTIILVLSTILLRFIFISKAEFPEDFTKIIFWGYLEISFTFFCVYAKYVNLWPIEVYNLNFIHNVGQFGLIIFFLVNFIFFKKPEANSSETIIYNDNNHQNALVLITVFISILSTLLSYYLGIMDMGVENKIVLPFKLIGILNSFRLIAMPLIFILILDSLYLHRKFKSSFFWIIYFSLWITIESVLRGSRSGLIFLVLLILFWGINRKLISWNKVVLGSLPIAFIFLIFVSFTTSIRNTQVYNHKYDKSYPEIVKETINRLSNGYVSFIFIRMFSAGIEIGKFEKVLKSNLIGGLFNEVLKVGSPAKYHTQYIDKNESDIQHSSGVTALGDGYLVFGLFGFAFTVFLISISAIGVDFYLNAVSVALQTMCQFFIVNILNSGSGLWNIFMERNISYLTWPIILIITFTFYYRNNKKLSFKK